MTDGDMWDDPAWLKDEVLRQRETIKAQQLNVQLLEKAYAHRAMTGIATAQTNLWLNRQLEAVEEQVVDFDDVGAGDQHPDNVYPVLGLTMQRIRDVVQRPRPEHVGPPEMMHVSFHWRDRSRPDGYSDALPGDGFGFAEAVEGFGLRMHFDCAGITACADLSFDALRATVAKEGYWLVKLTDLGLLSSDEAVRTMGIRITELERDLKSTEKQNKWLEAKLYGEGDERDNVRIAVDRAFVLECCTVGFHTFSWREGLEACRLCDAPKKPGKGTDS